MAEDTTRDAIREYLRDLARKRAAGRRRLSHVCGVCGKPFEGLARARFCSPTCRLRAHRARRQTDRSKQPALAAPAAEIPPLVARLDATCAAISRGRTFEDSADVIRASREERAAAE